MAGTPESTKHAFVDSDPPAGPSQTNPDACHPAIRASARGLLPPLADLLHELASEHCSTQRLVGILRADMRWCAVLVH